MKKLLALVLCALMLLGGMALGEGGATDGEYTVTSPGFYGELNVTGSSAYKLQDYKDAAKWVFEGKLNLKAIVTHVFKIEQFQEAYEAAKNGAGLKVELEP